MIADLFRFILYIIIFLVVPALPFLFYDEKDADKDGLLFIGKTLTLGILLNIAVSILIRALGFPWQVLWLLPLGALIFLFPKRSRLLILLKSTIQSLRKQKFLFLILAVLVFLQSLNLLWGGMHVGGGRLYPAFHDTMWNLAIAQDLKTHFPPQHPGFAGEVLKNNHYFYPLWLTGISEISSIDLFTLYFRLAPLLVSFLFGASIYVVSTLFFKPRKYQYLTVFLGYLCGSIAYIIPVFFHASASWSGNSFMSDQPFDQLTNPYTVLGFAIFLFAFYVWFKFLKSKEFNYSLAIQTVLYFGLLFGIKAFAGALAVGAMMVTSILLFFCNKYRTRLFILLLILIVFGGIFLLISSRGHVLFLWAPGWLLTQMVEGKEKLNLAGFVDKEAYYIGSHNWLGLLKIKGIELIIYTLGNLGVRIFGLMFLIWWAIKDIYKRTNTLPITIFFSISIATAILIPLFFSLPGSPFNIIQFTPYALLLLVFPLVVFLEKIEVGVRSKKYGKILALTITSLIVFLAIPVNVKYALEKATPPQEYVLSSSQSEALDFIKTRLETDAVIVTNPEHFPDSSIYIAAFTGRHLYLSDTGYALQTLLDPKTRLENTTRFFKSGDISGLKDLPHTYIYLLKNHAGMDPKQFFFPYTGQLEKVFESEEVVIFKIPKQP